MGTATQRSQSGAFAFANAPKAVSACKSRTMPPPAPEEEMMTSTNLMSDRRVVRGSMYSQSRNQADAQFTSSGVPFSAASKTTKRRTRYKEESIFDKKQQQPLVKREPVDLRPFLIEKERFKTSVEESTQSDELAPLSPAKPYVALKTGVDAATSMETDQPFDFEFEVQPLLEVIVGKTLAAALLEVHREEEVAAIAGDVAKKLAEKEAEAAALSTLEQAAASRVALRDAELRTAAVKLEREQALARKIASNRLISQILPEILEDAFLHFEQRGAWVDPSIYQLRAELLPWLYQKVDDELSGVEQGNALLDLLIKSALEAAEAAAAALRPPIIVEATPIMLPQEENPPSPAPTDDAPLPPLETDAPKEEQQDAPKEEEEEAQQEEGKS